MGLMGPVAAEKMGISRDMAGSSAQESDDFEHKDENEVQENELGIPIGSFTTSFDGFDMKERAVWLNDYRYELYPGFKVIGKHTKRGTLASIPSGATVSVVVKENNSNPMTPYLVEIRRGRE